MAAITANRLCHPLGTTTSICRIRKTPPDVTTGSLGSEDSKGIVIRHKHILQNACQALKLGLKNDAARWSYCRIWCTA